jgi:hypothetical protein
LLSAGSRSEQINGRIRRQESESKSSSSTSAPYSCTEKDLQRTSPFCTFTKLLGARMRCRLDLPIPLQGACLAAPPQEVRYGEVALQGWDMPLQGVETRHQLRVNSPPTCWSLIKTCQLLIKPELAWVVWIAHSQYPDSSFWSTEGETKPYLRSRILTLCDATPRRPKNLRTF